MATRNIEKIKYLTPQEITRLISKISNKRDKALFSIMYFYGLRCSEVSKILLEDIRIKDSRFYIKASKNGVSGEYVLTKEAKKILSAYLKERLKSPKQTNAFFLSRKGGALSTTQIRRLFYKYAKKARLPEDKQHPHVLRHSIAVHMAESGTPLEVVRIHLRHRKIDSTMVYFQITSKRRHELQKNALRGEYVARGLF